MKVVRINAWVMVGFALMGVVLALVLKPDIATEAVFMAFIVGAVSVAKDLVTPDPEPVVPAHIVERLIEANQADDA
jgi:hypothetical protein